MEQEYPGDTRPLMKACAEMARRRRGDLERVRQSVESLRDELAATLDQFDAERRAATRQVNQLRTDLRSRLVAARNQRAQAVASMRQRFAAEREQQRSAVQQELGQFRATLSGEVDDIKQRTQYAKSKRFKSGSFAPAAAKVAKTVTRAAAGIAQAVSKPAAKRTGGKSFLDAIEY